MPIIRLENRIRASAELCFDLARSIEAHMESTSHTEELAVAGKTEGLMDLGDEVTWEATHFGVRLRLTSRITAFDRPRHFRDSQQRGPFRRFNHDHFFEFVDGTTIMTDVFDYIAPLGALGRLADRLFLERYMTRLIERRIEVLKEIAEWEH